MKKLALVSIGVSALYFCVLGLLAAGAALLPTDWLPSLIFGLGFVFSLRILDLIKKACPDPLTTRQKLAHFALVISTAIAIAYGIRLADIGRYGRFDPSFWWALLGSLAAAVIALVSESALSRRRRRAR